MNEQEIRDDEQLKMLGLCHYLLGASTMAYSCMFLIHFALGLAMILRPDIFSHGRGVSMLFPGIFFAGIGGTIVLLGWITGGLEIYSGRLLRQHKRLLFSKCVAGWSCMSVPFGTALGVSTLVVLARPSVKRLYEGKPLPAIAPPPPISPAELSEHEESVWQALEAQANQQRTE